MAITAPEDEARKKICPFLERFCEGNDCLAWRIGTSGNGVCLRVLQIQLQLSRQKVGGDIVDCKR